MKSYKLGVQAIGGVIQESMQDSGLLKEGEQICHIEGRIDKIGNGTLLVLTCKIDGSDSEEPDPLYLKHTPAY